MCIRDRDTIEYKSAFQNHTAVKSWSVTAGKLDLHLNDAFGKDVYKRQTLISELNVSEGKKLMEDGFIGGGMLPKLHNCIDAIENGVSRVHILDGRIPHCLLLEIFTNKGIGTAIKNDVDERYYHGE